MVSRADLIKIHPNFAETADFPDHLIAFWSSIAASGLPAERLREPARVKQAHAAYVAHQLAIAAHVRAGSKAEFAPERPVRIAGSNALAAKRRRYVVYDSGGKLHKDFDTPDVEHPRAGPWNSTKFGHQLHQMAK